MTDGPYRSAGKPHVEKKDIARRLVSLRGGHRSYKIFVTQQEFEDNVDYAEKLRVGGHEPRVFGVFVLALGHEFDRDRLQCEYDATWSTYNGAYALYERASVEWLTHRKGSYPEAPAVPQVMAECGQILLAVDGLCRGDCPACHRALLREQERPLGTIGIFDSSGDEIEELRERLENLERTAGVRPASPGVRRRGDGSLE